MKVFVKNILAAGVLSATCAFGMNENVKGFCKQMNLALSGNGMLKSVTVKQYMEEFYKLLEVDGLSAGLLIAEMSESDDDDCNRIGDEGERLLYRKLNILEVDAMREIRDVINNFHGNYFYDSQKVSKLLEFCIGCSIKCSETVRLGDLCRNNSICVLKHDEYMEILFPNMLGKNDQKYEQKEINIDVYKRLYQTLYTDQKYHAFRTINLCYKGIFLSRFFKNILEGYIKVSNNGTFEMNYVGKANNFNISRLGIMYSDFSMSCPWMSELIDRLVYKKTSMHCMDLITF